MIKFAINKMTAKAVAKALNFKIVFPPFSFSGEYYVIMNLIESVINNVVNFF